MTWATSSGAASARVCRGSSASASRACRPITAMCASAAAAGAGAGCRRASSSYESAAAGRHPGADRGSRERARDHPRIPRPRVGAWRSLRPTAARRPSDPVDVRPLRRRKGTRGPPFAVLIGKRPHNAGKRGPRHTRRDRGKALQIGHTQEPRGTTENRGVPGSSPGLAIKTLLQMSDFCRALRGMRRGRKRQMAFPGIGD